MIKKLICVMLLFLLVFLSSCNSTNKQAKVKFDEVEDILDSYFGEDGTYSIITDDVVLPVSLKEVSLTWRSDKPDRITNNGKVTVSEEDIEVTLTAELKFNNKSRILNYKVIVQGKLANIYTITLDSKGGSKIESIIKEEGTVITRPTNPTKDGFIFIGWFEDEMSDDEYTFSTMPNKNLTLYARWEEVKYTYTITFDSKGGSKVASITEEYGEIITRPMNPTRDGYVFLGWYEDEVTNVGYTFTTMPKKNLTLYARWGEIKYPYTITFDSKGGSKVSSITAEYETPITRPTDPTRDGYIFKGWYEDEVTNVEYTFTTMPKKDLTLYARWEEVIGTYTITFETKGGSRVASITAKYETKITRPVDPTKDGYIFIGWYENELSDDEFEFSTMPKKNLTLYARWEEIKKTYTITFDSKGGSEVESITGEYSTSISRPVDPTKDGYIFMGWYDDESLVYEYDFITMPNKNFTLHAKWEEIVYTYTITFDSMGGTHVASITEQYEATFTRPADPTKDGYIFIGWFENAVTNIQYTFNTMPNKNFVLYARWEEIVVTHTITFDGMGGSEVASITDKYGAVISRPIDPIKDGYIFMGWFEDELSEDEFVFSTMPKKNLTLYARWEEIIVTYTITFDSKGGSYVATINEEYDAVITKPADPTKDGYIFIGWFEDELSDEEFVFSTMPNENITLFARWEEIILGTKGLEYNLKEDGTYEVSNYVGNEAHVIVPDTYKRIPITSIGKYAFNNCIVLSSIVLPQNLTSIADWAFGDCTNLVSIVFPESLTSIGACAFVRCRSLTSVTFPESLTSIGVSAFNTCTNLSSIILPEGLTSIGASAFSDCTSLTSIILPDGLTNLESWTFNGCSSLTSVILPSQLTNLGYYVFYSCASLTNVVLPDKLINISDSAFSECTSLTSITLPNSVVSLGNWTFTGCSNLTTITLSENLKTIGFMAFSRCTSLTSIIIPEGLENIGSSVFDGCLNLSSITLPFVGLNREAMGSDARFGTIFGTTYFSGSYNANGYYIPSNLKEVVITNAPTLEKSAFYDCTSLTNIILPENLTVIGNSVFYNCTSLSNITLPDGLSTIGESAFYNCTSLVSITLPEGVARVEKSTFYNCLSLTNVTLSEGLISIGEYAFRGCESLTNVTLPTSLMNMGKSAFGGCISLSSITLPFVGSSRDATGSDALFGRIFGSYNYSGSYYANGYFIPNNLEQVDVTDTTNIGDFAFSSCNSLKVITLEEGITNIGSSAFYNCTSLISMTLPEGLTSISSFAFDYCTNLTSVTLPEGLTSISSFAFSNCTSLTNITLPKSLVSIENSAFSNCTSLIGITVFEGLTTLGDSVFYNCISLTSIVLPQSLTNLGNSALSGCMSLTSITLPFVGTSRDAVGSESIFGYSFGSYYYSGSYYANGFFIPNSLEQVVVTDSKSIGENAFLGCTNLTNVTFQEGITYLGSFAFSGCISLASIIFPQSLNSIGDSAFYNCTSLTNITLPENLASIESLAFSECTNLTSITLPEGLSNMGSDVFNGCSSLTSITLPFVGMRRNATGTEASFGSIFGSSYYQGSYNANAHYIPYRLRTVVVSGTTSIEDYAFYGCTSLHSVTFLETITSIGSFAFNGCTSIINVSYPEGLTNIGESAFSGCTSLTNITFSEVLTTLGSSAFRGCASLSNVTLPNSLLSIEDSMFSGCTSLTNISLSESLTSIGKDVFSDCISLTNISFPESIISIGDSAFKGCVNLTNPTLPEGLTIIGDFAFYDCTNFTNITFPETLTSIGASAFHGCVNLSNLTFREGLISIGDSAFRGCASLTNLTLPTSLASIGDSAFGGCIGLSSITLPFVGSSRNAIGSGARFGYIFGSFSTGGYSTGDYYIPNQLKEVIITDTTSIGGSAFSGCKSLTSITFPENLTFMGDFALSDCTGLTSITLPEGLTRIEDSTFSNCTNLLTITLPNSLTSIGSSVFSRCTNLIDIRLPEGLTSIGDYAFYNCASLDNIVLPEGLTSIGDFAFVVCHTLTSITLPESLQTIGVRAFSQCMNLTSIILPNGVSNIGKEAFYMSYSLTIYAQGSSQHSGWNSNWNTSNRPVYYGVDEVMEYIGLQYLIFNDSITITRYTGFESSLVLPSMIGDYPVTKIGASAFSYCKSLWSITFPESLTTIERTAFLECSNLTNIEITEGLTSIGASAFANCRSLVNFTFPKSIFSIDMHAFANCTSLTSIVLPKGLTNIGSGAFNNCTKLTIYTILDAQPFGWDGNWTNRPVYYGVEEVLEYNGIEYLIIDGSITITRYIGNDSSIVIPSNIDHYPITSIGNYAFSNCSSIISVVIQEGLIRIEESAFSNCVYLTSITLPESLASVGGSAFGFCRNLTSITFYEGLTNIARNTFSHCTNLTSVVLPEILTSIEYSAFYNCISLTSINLPAGLSSIGDSAFYNCRSLTSITLPESLTSIGYNAFIDCRVLIIHAEVSSEQSGWSAQWNSSNRPVYYGMKEILEYDGVQYLIIDKGITVARYMGNASTLVIPSSIHGYTVTRIEEFAFYSCTSLISVSLPDSMTTIGNSAFTGCSNLKTIDLPKGLTTIGNFAFSWCENLEIIRLPEGITTIGDSAFERCRSLKGINLPNSLTSIGDSTFSLCSSLTTIVIPIRLETIGNEAFAWCNALIIYAESSSKQSGWSSSWNSLNQPVYYGVEKLLEYEGLQYVVIHDSITITRYVGTETNLVIPSSIDGYSVSAIGNVAFYDCTKLTSILIPESVTTIGSSTFYNCKSLIVYTNHTWKPWDWSSSWNSWRPVYYGVDQVFNYDGLQYLIIDDSITITRYTGDKTTLEIPSSINGYPVTRIGEYAFSDFTNMINITLPEGIQRIGDYAFYDCRSLTSLNLPECVTSVGTRAFYGCAALSSIIIPRSLTSIGYGAFWECGKITIYARVSNQPIGWESWENNNRPVYFGVEEVFESNGFQYLIFDNSLTITRYLGNETTLVLPSSINGYEVTHIGEAAFSNNTTITSITFPESVTSIGNNAFYNCASLTSVTFSEGLISIGSNAFYNCKGLTNIVFPEGLITIGSSAFGYCTNLKSAIVPESVTSIEILAFAECRSLVIYAKTTSKPIGWMNWDQLGYVRVYWGFVGD